MQTSNPTVPTPPSVSALLDEIQARATEKRWPTVAEIGALRNDNTALVAALRAVLVALDEDAAEWRATSTRMGEVVKSGEPHDFDRDDLIRYAAYASAAERTARRAHTAITTALSAVTR